MKKIQLIPLLSLAALTLTLCQCAAPTTSNDGSATAPAGSSSSDGAIKPGMTKAEVIAVWGEPSEKKPTASGEVWRWADQGWKRQVPVWGAFTSVEEHVVRFGADGRVAGTGKEDYGNAWQEGYRRSRGTN
jgi:outer membrane protein assembly factor BamE (lipoprotein component of BamABCDE complex)